MLIVIVTILGRSMCSAYIYCENNGEYIFNANSYVIVTITGRSISSVNSDCDNNGEVYMQCNSDCDNNGELIVQF